MPKRKTREVWVDIRHATREQMEMAFAQRREQICKELRQFQIDVDGFNQNWNKGEPIKVVFDFTDDLAELAVMEK